MTLKEEIERVLDTVNTPYAYGYTPKSFPSIRYTLISNTPIRLSNSKAYKNIEYQIDVFHQEPFDVEDENSLLEKIEQGLEQTGLNTTNWIENIVPDDRSQFTVYHYFMTVRS